MIGGYPLDPRLRSILRHFDSLLASNRRENHHPPSPNGDLTSWPRLLHTETARVLYGSPFLRRRNAVLLTVALLLLLASTIAMLLHTFGMMDTASLAVFLQALAISSVALVVPLLILRWLDRREPESLWMFAIAFLWGGLIATGLALPLNNAILGGILGITQANPAITDFLGPDAAFMIGAPIAGPLVEEITKGLGVVLLFVLFRAEFDNVRDGFIYGALVGVGFNWLEAPLYVAQGFAEFGVAPFGLQLGGRYALFGLAGHALYTGLFGAFLGLARQSTDRWLRRAAAHRRLVARHRRAFRQQCDRSVGHHRHAAQR